MHAIVTPGSSCLSLPWTAARRPWTTIRLPQKHLKPSIFRKLVVRTDASSNGSVPPAKPRYPAGRRPTKPPGDLGIDDGEARSAPQRPQRQHGAWSHWVGLQWEWKQRLRRWQRSWNELSGRLLYSYFNWRQDTWSDLQLFLWLNTLLFVAGAAIQASKADVPRLRPAPLGLSKQASALKFLWFVLAWHQ
jgi:hypothetical protein